MKSTPILALAVAALASASTLTPNVLPLIVRNPYLSIWLTGARNKPWEKWPIFWTGHSVGFSVMAKDPHADTVFPLLGRPQDSFPMPRSPGFEVRYPKYVGATFDASTTNLTYQITSQKATEPLEMTLSFLSPITPSSTFRQSIPASYMTVYVNGTFDINVYVDVNGEWVSGDRATKIQWEFVEGQEDPSFDENWLPVPPEITMKTWKVERQTQLHFSEIDDRGEWGSLYFNGPPSASHQSGQAQTIRNQFARQGHMLNSNDNNHREMFESEPLFAFAESFKLSANETSKSATFTFGLVQDEVVQFAGENGTVAVPAFWKAIDKMKSGVKIMQYHYRDLVHARRLAQDYSDRLSKDAYASGSKEYEEIAALSARQVMGGTVFGGTPEKPYLFLKEISSDGNCQTVDVIFPAHPFFLYTNARWLTHLLEPLLEHMGSGAYPNNYSMHDLGSSFPNNTGHADGKDEYMPVEECGNMLIMALAHAHAIADDRTWPLTNDFARSERLLIDEWQRPYIDEGGMDRDAKVAPKHPRDRAREWLAKRSKLWGKWAGYLVKYSLLPEHQLSTDDFAGWLANQTNLALKGIIGIRAMSEITQRVMGTEEEKPYRGVAEKYIKHWQEYGISRDGTHAKLAYTWFGSWTTLYNLFADSLLCFNIPGRDPIDTPIYPQTYPSEPLWTPKYHNFDCPTCETWRVGGHGGRRIGNPYLKNKTDAQPFIPKEVYKMQSDWYQNVIQKYGLPLDSRHLYTKSDWQFFAAAVSSAKTRKAILTSVARWVNETTVDRPLTDLYETEEGGYPKDTGHFKARPVVGGHFAFLALEKACGGEAMANLAWIMGEKVVVEEVEVDKIVEEVQEVTPVVVAGPGLQVPISMDGMKKGESEVAAPEVVGDAPGPQTPMSEDADEADDVDDPEATGCFGRGCGRKRGRRPGGAN